MKIPNWDYFPAEGVQLDKQEPKEFSFSLIINSKPIVDPFKVKLSLKRRKAFKVIQGGKSGSHK